MTNVDTKTLATALAALVVVSVVAGLSTIVFSWLLMLFLGNLGVHVSLLGALPGALLLTGLRTTVTKEKGE